MTNKQVRWGSGVGEGMVLSRAEGAALTGTAAPGSEFTLELQGQRREARADAAGRWLVRWSGLAPGGPFVLSLDGGPGIQELWVGDVWLCAGQSNMERSLEASAGWPTDPDRLAADPAVRQLAFPYQFSWDGPREDLPGGRWTPAGGPGTRAFSAVAYWFARKLREETGVPQGVVVLAVGGSTAEAWMTPKSLEAFPRDRAEFLRWSVPGRVDEQVSRDAARTQRWLRGLDRRDPPDPHRAGTGLWRPVTMPACGPDQGLPAGPGSWWLRRIVRLDEVPEEEARLRLGTLVDSDQVWVNGRLVGTTGYRYPSRRYPVPAGILRRGDNEFLIRLVAPEGGAGGTPGKAWTLELGPGREPLPLGRAWEWRPGASARRLPPAVFLPFLPAGLRWGMLEPLRSWSFRAVLWYQGESNTHNGMGYQARLEALMADWRDLFGRQDLPFFVVQLPRFGPEGGPDEPGWAEVREAQRRVCRRPGAELVVALDTGDWNDIHPGGKEIVGARLARAVRTLAGLPVQEPWTGPQPSRIRTEGSDLTVEFLQAGTGLTGGEGAWEAAGPDRRFEKVGAVTEGPRVRIRWTGKGKVRWVRYAWGSNPAGATLVNSAGLPATPFVRRVGVRENP